MSSRFELDSPKILELLREKPTGLTVSQISIVLSLNRNSVAKYLDILLISGKVHSRRFGPAKIFKLSNSLSLSKVMNISSDFLVTLDSEGRVVHVNKSMLDFLDISKEDFIGQKLPNRKFIFFSYIGIGDLLLLDNSIVKEENFEYNGQKEYFQIKSIPVVRFNGTIGRTIIIRNKTIIFQNQLQLKEYEERMQTLYKIMAGNYSNSEKQVTAVLEIVTKMFELDLAVVSEMVDDNCFVKYCYDPMNQIKVGDSFKEKETYCNLVVSNNNCINIVSMSESEHKNQECFNKFGFETYIGTPLRQNDIAVGALSFFGRASRKKEFTVLDDDFVQLLGEWIEKMLHYDGITVSELQFFKFAKDLFCVIDADGVILKINSRVEEFLGYKPEEVIGSKLIKYVSLVDQQRTKDEFKHVINGKETSKFKIGCVAKDASIVNMSWSCTNDTGIFYITARLADD